MHKNVSLTWILLLGLVSGLYCGCTHTAGVTLPPAQATPNRGLLQTRIDEFIKAQNAEDLATTYTFYSPQFRKQCSLVQFIKENSGASTKMKLDAIDYTPGANSADVTLLGDFMVMSFEIKEFPMSQHWVFIKDEWYIDAPPPESMESLFINNGQKRKSK